MQLLKQRSIHIRILMKIIKIILAVLVLLITGYGKVQAQRPSSEMLQQLRLPAPFTLKYKVHVKEVRTPEMKKAAYAEVASEYSSAVKNGKMAQEQADQVLKNLHEQMSDAGTDTTLTVTLSAREGKILCMTEQNDQKHITLYDGQDTYVCPGGSGAGTLAYINPGLTFDDFQECPFPAAGLPYLPLVKPLFPVDAVSKLGNPKLNGNVPLSGGGANHGMLFMPAEITSDFHEGKAEILQTLASFKSAPIERWQFAKHQKFDDVWLASEIKHTRYESIKPDPLHPKTYPVTISFYSLKEATLIPLDAKMFDFLSYLKSGMAVNDRRTHHTAAFTYDALKGDLETQEQHQAILDREVASNARRGKIASHSPVGLLLLIALIFAVLGWLIWKRQVSS